MKKSTLDFTESKLMPGLSKTIRSSHPRRGIPYGIMTPQKFNPL